MYANQIKSRGAVLGANTAGALSADTEAAMAQRAETELAALFSRCTDSLCRLESAVSALNSRLSPVIRPIPVASIKDDGESIPLSPLGGEVAMVTSRLDALQHQIYTVLEALAV
jgi:hypothetical protein